MTKKLIEYLVKFMYVLYEFQTKRMIDVKTAILHSKMGLFYISFLFCMNIAIGLEFFFNIEALTFIAVIIPGGNFVERRLYPILIVLFIYQITRLYRKKILKKEKTTMQMIYEQYINKEKTLSHRDKVIVWSYIISTPIISITILVVYIILMWE